MKTGTNLPVFYYIIHIIKGEFMKNTLLVNLYAGPGAGKSTGAAYIFAKLKMAGVDCEYVSEKIGRKFGRISRSHETEYYSYRHSQYPQHGYCRVLPYLLAAVEQLNAYGRCCCKNKGSDSRTEREIHSHSHPSERSVCYSATDEEQSSCNNVRAYYSTRYTRKQCAYECIPEKYILQQLHRCGIVRGY